MTTDLMTGTDLTNRRDDALAPQLAEERGGITPVAALQRRIEVILDVMANVLEPAKDYGVIPGTDKPSLFKPGAEKLCLLFQLAAADPYVDDLSDGDAIRYRVRVPIVAPNGRVLAVGVGEASTGEEKYKWRRPVCDEEFAETPATLRREKWFRGKNGQPNYKSRQVRTVPTDAANTVLKMAHKRGYIHGVLMATGASSIFNQDLEHMQAELRESVVEDDAEVKAPRSVAPPQRKSESAAAPGLDSETIDGVLVSCALAGSRYNLKVKGDKRDFTAFDDAVGLAGVALVGKVVRVTFTTKHGEKRDFYNVSAIAGVPAAVGHGPAGAGGTGAVAGAAAPVITADRIPFGDEPRREPGQEG